MIRGTRIPVQIVLGQRAEGGSWDSILTGYPELKRENTQPAVRLAQKSLLGTEITDLSPG